MASANGHLKIVKYLVSMGTNIHWRQEKYFRSACSNGHLELVKYLVESGVDIYAKNDYALKVGIFISSNICLHFKLNFYI